MDKRLSISDFNERYLSRLGDCLHSDNHQTIVCNATHLPFFDKLVQFDFALVILCKQGRIEAVINDVRYTASKGDMLFFSGMHTVTEAMITTDFLCDLFCISNKIYHNSIVPDKETMNNFLFAYSSPLTALTEQELELVSCYQDLIRRKEADEHNYYSQRIFNSLMQAIIFEFMSACDKRKKHTANTNINFSLHKSNLAHDFLILLSDGVENHRSVGYFADRLCVSSKYLTQVVKSETGKTVSQWIQEQLTEQIRHLLLNTSLSCKEIASQLGFSNISFFGKFTKAHLGASPMVYRARERQSTRESSS